MHACMQYACTNIQTHHTLVFYAHSEGHEESCPIFLSLVSFRTLLRTCTVHSLLPFILLGVGVDDAFVIVNAFNRERKVPRNSESNEDITKRSARAMARAGASITVTSLTDLVAFGISASSRLPTLASCCAYAAIGIVFLWILQLLWSLMSVARDWMDPSKAGSSSGK